MQTVPLTHYFGVTVSTCSHFVMKRHGSISSVSRRTVPSVRAFGYPPSYPKMSQLTVLLADAGLLALLIDVLLIVGIECLLAHGAELGTGESSVR